MRVNFAETNKMTVHHAQLRSGTKRVKEGNHSLARDTVLVDLMAFFNDCRDDR